MHHLVPHFILENDRQGKQAGSFQAAGLFVDTTGFSVMTDALMEHGQHGAEVLAGVMRSTFQPLMQAVFEQGGFVTALEGDSFTALFPEEPGQGSAAPRALAAARQMQQAASAQALHLTPYGEFQITIKIGLALGSVEWGILSSADRQRAVYFFRGNAVEQSAQAENAAQSGETLMSGSFYAAVQELTEAEPTADFFRLRRVTGALPTAQPIRATEADAARGSIFYPRELFTQTYPGEFRLVANLFISLPTLPDMQQLRLFMQSAFELQDMYGGLLKLFFGDKGAHLLLIWGAPVSKENDLERALNFILELQARTTLPIKAGLTYQIAHTGYVGSDLAEDFCAYGRGTNLAARFMTQAPRGAIWVDRNCVRREERRFTFEPDGERTFKGFAKPEKVYLLVDRKEEAEIFFHGKMVGRESELSLLARHVQPIFEGKYAGLMVIWGEPGQGKSRLVHEFLRLQEKAAPGAFQIFLGQCDEILRQPLNPLRYWLLRHFQVSDSQGELRNKRSFNHKLDELITATQDERLANELDRTRSLLGALMGLHWADSLYEQLDAKGRYENTRIALAALLRAESLRQPVILFVEDAHWFDEETKALLPALLQALQDDRPGGYPVAILASARFEGVGLPLENIPCTDLHLSALAQDSLALLAESILQGPVSPNLLNLLQEQADGNPFFTEQILLYARENNLLERRFEGWSIRANRPVTLPTDVNVLLIARLDRLVREVREIVQRASVLGREFEVQLLLHMLKESDRPALNGRITQAEAESIWVSLNRARYIFKHALMRDAAYQMQLQARQKELHVLALEAYEHIYSYDLPGHSGELAYHAEQAGDREKARRYLRMAGARAEAVYQNRVAVDCYSRALAYTPQADTEERCRLLLSREHVYSVIGGTAERQRDIDTLAAMLPEVRDVENTIEIVLRQSSCAFDTGFFTQAWHFARRAEALLDSSQHADQALEALMLQGLAAFRLGEYGQSVAMIEKGLDLARETGNRHEESRLYNSLGMIHIEQGRLVEAQAAFQMGLSLAKEAGHLRNQALPLNNLGKLAGNQGNYAAALSCYEEGLALARKIGERAGEGLILGNLGFITMMLGDYQKARAYLEQNLPTVRETRDTNAETYSLINLSACSGALGDHESAIRYAESALALARKTGDRSAEAWALTYLGHARLALAHTPKAVAAYQAALEIRQALHQAVLSAEPAAGLAQAALAAGDVPLARERLAPILALLESGSSLDGTDEPLRVYLTCFLALKKTDPARARETLQTARQLLIARSESIQDAAMRESFLNNIAHHREILTAWANTVDSSVG